MTLSVNSLKIYNSPSLNALTLNAHSVRVCVCRCVCACVWVSGWPFWFMLLCASASAANKVYVAVALAAMLSVLFIPCEHLENFSRTNNKFSAIFCQLKSVDLCICHCAGALIAKCENMNQEVFS